MHGVVKLPVLLMHRILIALMVFAVACTASCRSTDSSRDAAGSDGRSADSVGDIAAADTLGGAPDATKVDARPDARADGGVDSAGLSPDSGGDEAGNGQQRQADRDGCEQ